MNSGVTKDFKPLKALYLESELNAVTSAFPAALNSQQPSHSFILRNDLCLFIPRGSQTHWLHKHFLTSLFAACSFHSTVHCQEKKYRYVLGCSRGVNRRNWEANFCWFGREVLDMIFNYHHIVEGGAICAYLTPHPLYLNYGLGLCIPIYKTVWKCP